MMEKGLSQMVKSLMDIHGLTIEQAISLLDRAMYDYDVIKLVLDVTYELMEEGFFHER